MKGKKELPNIILIIADCLRQDYAYDSKIMPFLNSFKNKNWYSTRAYTNATDTSFAIPTILTGLAPFEITNKPGIQKEHLHRYLPKKLKEQGYTTIGITGNVITSKYFNFHHGFDYFQDFLFSRKENASGLFLRNASMRNKTSEKIRPASTHRWLTKKIKIENLFKAQNIKINKKIRGGHIYNELKKINIKEPVFMFLHLMEPHAPYAPLKYCFNNSSLEKIERIVSILYKSPSDLTLKQISFLKKMYTQEIEDLDNILRKMIKFLKSKLDWPNTICVITADHGEALGETDYFTHPAYKLNNINHIKVPLVIKTLEETTLEVSEKEIWSWHLYEFLGIRKLEFGEGKDFCLGYRLKKVKGTILNSESEFFPVAYFKPSKNILLERGNSLLEINPDSEINVDIKNELKQLISEKKRISRIVRSISK